MRLRLSGSDMHWPCQLNAGRLPVSSDLPRKVIVAMVAGRQEPPPSLRDCFQSTTGGQSIASLAATLEASMIYRTLIAATLTLVLLSIAGCASERANTYSSNPSQGQDSKSSEGGGGMGGGNGGY